MQPYFMAIDPGTFGLIVLDAWYRMLPEGCSENENSDMAPLYNAVDRYAEHLGCAFLLVHHSSKGVQAGKNVVDVGSGASAQARAVDSHFILRAHKEDNAVAVEAAVRSWPPLDPFCLRWQYPVWEPAQDLDPADLRQDNRKKKPEQEQPAETTWTPEQFVSQFLTATPRTMNSIIVAAETSGLSERRATRLLAAAEEGGIAFRWVPQNRNQAVRFANREQTLTETTK
jgi:hypothetical protein